MNKDFTMFGSQLKFYHKQIYTISDPQISYSIVNALRCKTIAAADVAFLMAFNIILVDL